ncbi:MAG TPA: hypothetical protein VGK58_08795 [Lacipirellulaceae bacterium]
MGIRLSCPNGHKLNVKDNLAGKRGICPACGAKFVIPAASEPAPAAGQPAGDTGISAQSAAAGGAPSSPSIVIALADAPPKSAPVIAPAAPAPPAVNVNSSQPPQTTAPAATAAPKVVPAPSAETPIVLTDSDHPAAAVSKYVTHRMRIRRLQTTIAIALLIAVVVLGVVLVWVLSGGPETASARQTSSSAQSSYTYSRTHRTPSEGWSTYSLSQ